MSIIDDDFDIPRPEFPEEPIGKSGPSPPKRLCRQQRKSLMSPPIHASPPFPEQDLVTSSYSTENISGLRDFCENNGIADLAHRCGVLPSDSAFSNGSLTNKELDIIKSIEESSSPPFIHPYAQPTTQLPIGGAYYDETFVAETPREISEDDLPLPMPLHALSKNEKEEEEEYISPPRTTKTRRGVAKKPIKQPKATKGLRNLSHLVLEKVEQKGTTTYNQVSDELVDELKASGAKGDGKNIRRRVYDALNVLRSINIITKDKKQITWVGLPQHSAEALNRLQLQKQQILHSIEQKRENFQEVTKQLTSYQMIAARNRQFPLIPEDQKITFPLILATSPSGAPIDCEMADNRSEYLISFRNPFKLYTEVQLLEMMNFNPTADNSNYSTEPPTPSHIPPSFLTGPPNAQ